MEAKESRWNIFKKKFYFDASYFIAFYIFALLILFSSFSFHNYRLPNFFSDFLFWSFTLLIPNIYLFTIFQISKGGQVNNSIFWIFISMLLATIFLIFYLIFNLSQKFTNFIGTNEILIIIIIITGVINLLLCRKLARPFTRDIEREVYERRFEKQTEIKEDAQEIKEELKKGIIE